MTKDCPLHRGQVKDGGGRGLCMRCGKAHCAAADYSDWYRWAAVRACAEHIILSAST